jgi:hypothetical protein
MPNPSPGRRWWSLSTMADTTGQSCGCPDGWAWLQQLAEGEGRRGPRHVEQIGVASGAVMQTPVWQAGAHVGQPERHACELMEALLVSLPASSPWVKWVTRPSCWPCCWPPASASRCPSSWASWWPHWPTTRWPALWANSSPAPWDLSCCAGSSGCPFWPWPAGCWCRTKIDDAQAQHHQRLGVFGTTVVAFFLAEMGDKTQIATVALAARFDDLVAVVAGHHAGHDAGQCASGLPGRCDLPAGVDAAGPWCGRPDFCGAGRLDLGQFRPSFRVTAAGRGF